VKGHLRAGRRGDESAAVVAGRFVGLVIDEDNEAEMSDDRVVEGVGVEERKRPLSS